MDHVRGVVDEMKIALDETPRRRGGGIQYALLALPRRRLVWPGEVTIQWFVKEKKA